MHNTVQLYSLTCWQMWAFSPQLDGKFQSSVTRHASIFHHGGCRHLINTQDQFRWVSRKLVFLLNHAVFTSSKIHTHKKQTAKILEYSWLVSAEVRQTYSSEQLSAFCVCGPVVKDTAPTLEAFTVLAGDWTYPWSVHSSTRVHAELQMSSTECSGKVQK